MLDFQALRETLAAKTIRLELQAAPLAIQATTILAGHLRLGAAAALIFA